MPEHVVIIGSGPAGHTAAIYTARANLKPVMFEGFSVGGIPGGQLMTTTEVENYPGFPSGVDGQELMVSFRKQSVRFGTRIFTEDVTKVNLSKRPFVVSSAERTVETHAFIIATGATAKRLDLGDTAARRAMEAGVMLAISTDTHSLDQLDQMAIGLGVARRAWLEPRHLLNCFSLKELTAWIARKRKGVHGR